MGEASHAHCQELGDDNHRDADCVRTIGARLQTEWVLTGSVLPPDSVPATVEVVLVHINHSADTRRATFTIADWTAIEGPVHAAWTLMSRGSN